MCAGDEGDGEQSLANMFFEAKTKGISDDSYADWQAIVEKECQSEEDRNYSFKASKRIFRLELAHGDFAKASATFQRLVSFIPKAEPNAVRKGFLNRKQAKNLLHIVCPKLNLVHLPPLTTISLFVLITSLAQVPYLRRRSAIEKTDAEIPFILSIHQTLLKAVEAMRSTLLDVWKACSLRLAKLHCCLGEVGASAATRCHPRSSTLMFLTGAAIDILCAPGGLFSLYRDDSGKDAVASASNLIELYV